MKKINVTVGALVVLFALVLLALPAEAGSRRSRGGLFIAAPGIAFSTGRPYGISVFLSADGPGYYYSGAYGPRSGHSGYRRHRPGPRYYREPYLLPPRFDSRWERHSLDRHRPPPTRKWTSRTWVPGGMTSRGFVPGYWGEAPLVP